MEYKVILSNEEDKALKYVAYDVQEWIDNAIHDRARRAMDEIVTEHSNKQANKISLDEKNQIVRDADIKTAKERQDELEAEMKK